MAIVGHKSFPKDLGRRFTLNRMVGDLHMEAKRHGDGVRMQVAFDLMLTGDNCP
ncbi:hypothetical protein D3C77_751290 [compost metagenome]